MIIAGRFTYWGSCLEAISFYCDIFHFKIEKLVKYGECEDLGIPLFPEHEELVHSAVIIHPSGFRMFMCDSFSMLISKDHVAKINLGHLSVKGCREGAPLEVYNLNESEIIEIYKLHIENQSIPHISLGARGKLKLYASVMDKFNLCWNLSCEG